MNLKALLAIARAARASPMVEKARESLALIKGLKWSALHPFSESARGEYRHIPFNARYGLPSSVAEVADEAHKQAYAYGIHQPSPKPTTEMMAAAQRESIDPAIRPLLGLSAKEMAVLSEGQPLSILDAALGPVKEPLPVSPDLFITPKALSGYDVNEAGVRQLWDAVASRRPDIARRINKFNIVTGDTSGGYYMPRVRSNPEELSLADLLLRGGGYDQNAIWYKRGNVGLNPQLSKHPLSVLLHEGIHALQGSPRRPMMTPRFSQADVYRDELGPIFEELQANVLENRAAEALARNTLRSAIRYQAAKQAAATHLLGMSII